MSEEWRQRLLFTAKMAAAAGLLAWLLLSGRLDLRRLASIPLSADLGVLFGLSLGSMALPAVRWWWLLRIQGLHEPLGKVAALTWAAYFAALVLPGAASGDLAKGYLILRHRPRGRARAFSTVLADRVIGLHSLLVLGAAAILWLTGRGEVGPAVQAMAGAILVLLVALTLGAASLLFPPSRRLLLLVLPQRWREAWNKSFDFYCVHKAALLGCFGLSLASSAMTIGTFGIAARLLGERIPWDATFLAGPLIVLSNCLPLTPGGMGVAEAVSSGLFASVGTLCGAEMMIILRLCSTAVSLPGIVPTVFVIRAMKPRAVSSARNAQTGHCTSLANKGQSRICEGVAGRW